ncbi:antitermination protein [Pantoea agglomerans]|uniref:antitermination protein Q n=1 Tax=Enterobacter agglomerans TaxID=549 RepID=UPI002413BE28|nr:antitermination protein [Pantoea agglomerans]
MNLESAIKFFAPKSPQLSDSPPATAKDSLTITDVMASFGLTEAQARFGFELFLSKHGITSSDRAVEMLTDFGIGKAVRYRAIAELDEETKRSLVQLLATFAYQDYTRSAASTRQCPCCSGTRFIDAEVFTNKTYYPDGKPPIWARSTKGVFPSYWEETKPKREAVRVLCKSCNGKGEISNACRCHGKGTVLDKELSELQGVPVTKECPKCSGRGYARLPSEVVRRAVAYAVMTISEPTWRRSFKPFYELLITQCHKEEAYADAMLAMVTR